jgi:hypothetical protein
MQKKEYNLNACEAEFRRYFFATDDTDVTDRAVSHDAEVGRRRIARKAVAINAKRNHRRHGRHGKNAD